MNDYRKFIVVYYPRRTDSNGNTDYTSKSQMAFWGYKQSEIYERFSEVKEPQWELKDIQDAELNQPMRTILYTTGLTPTNSTPHRWRIKTHHDTLSGAERCAHYEMDCAAQKYPADGYVIVWEESPLEVILSSLPGHIDFNPESGGFTDVTLP